MFIDAANMAKAREGEWVEIQLEESNFLKAVAIMYGIPLIGLLAGLALGSVMGALFIPRFADMLAIVLGLGGAGLSFVVIHMNEARFRTKKFKPSGENVDPAQDNQ